MTDWVRPPRLARGDLVAVCAPAGAVAPEKLAAGAAALERLGFRVRVGDGLLDKSRFMAGTVERRVAELVGLFADDEVKAIVCARGGAGVLQILPRIDPPRVHKVFVGYSDISFLHLLLHKHRLVTLHGPMVAKDLAAGSIHAASLLHGLTGEGPPYATEADDLITLRPGTGEGRLLGGCLSILAAAAGTPWALRPQEPTVLFLEDVDEAPYRVDRLLRQLRHSGAFDGIAGIVFGDMRGCAPPMDADFTLEEVILAALDGLDIPIAIGLSSGHTAGANVTLPLGVRCRLACDGEARFEVLEPAVQ